MTTSLTTTTAATPYTTNSTSINNQQHIYHTTTTTNQHPNIHPTVSQIAHLPISQLQALIANVTQQNKTLKEEIHLGEDYLEECLGSGDLHSAAATQPHHHNRTNSSNGTASSPPDSGAEDSDSQAAGGAGSSVASSSPRGGASGNTPLDSTTAKKKKKKKRIKRHTRNLATLSLERKLEVVQRQIETLNTLVEAEKKDFKKKVDNFTAAMEEADIEIDSADKEHKEFVRVIMKAGINQRTQKILAEKLLNFMDNELKQRDQLIDKYRLKNTAMKAQIKKLKQHLEHREEMGEILSKIDYDQLEIENEQMRRKISERNSELVQLTLQTGKTIQTLNALMDKLNRLTQNANQLRKQIEVRENTVDQIKQEIVQVKQEKFLQEKKHKSLRQHLEEVRVPSILDYVKIKAELDVIRKEVVNWERKVEISETNRKLYGSKLRKVKTSGTV